jgi:hypothetical protein
MIQSASFRNFKSLRHVDIDFERLTVFVGPNASGKTSILEGLYYLTQCALIETNEVFTGDRAPELLYSRGMSGNMEIECRNADAAFRFEAKPLAPLSGDRPHPGLPSKYSAPRWNLRVECQDRKEGNGAWGPPSADLWRDPIASRFRSAKMLCLDARTLAQPSYSDHPKPELTSEGGGMASLLAYMALSQPDRFSSLQERTKSVIPPLKRIRFDRVPVSKLETEVVTIDSDRLTRRLKRDYIGDEVVLDFEGASDIPAHLASEGTILVLGLLTALLGPSRPSLILLDDIDHGLHPKAQRKLVPLLHSILQENSDLQVVATTHSPYIVNELDPKEVRVAWAVEDGVTRCAHLDSHPEFERWKDEMWPGEFWSVVGEEWVGNGQGRESL